MKYLIFIILLFSFVLKTKFLEAQEGIKGYQTDSKSISSLCFNSDGSQLAVADNMNIKVFSVEKQKQLKEFNGGHEGKILSIDITSDNRFMVSAGLDSSIVIWDLDANKMVNRFTFHKAIITSVKISPDGRYLASGGSDSKVCIYDLHENVVKCILEDHSLDITSIDFSNDGKLFGTASGDKTIAIYETGTFNLINTLHAHKNWIREIKFSDDASRLVSCGDDGKIIVWKMAKNNMIILNEHKLNSGWVLCSDFNEDNKTVAAAGMSGKGIIICPLGKYKFEVDYPINKIRFQSNIGTSLKVVIATQGGGVLMMDAKGMSFK